LDISRLDSDFNDMGQHPYHPRMLLRLLIWGMANRIVSTRKIEVLVRRGDKKVIERDGSSLCPAGNGESRAIALDETKLNANTSKHKSMSCSRMKEEEYSQR